MDEPNVITPTVGRIVHFYLNGRDAPEGFWQYDAADPYAAIVTAVHGDRCVNLGVFDVGGRVYSFTSVDLRQPGDAEPDWMYCEWMPYQMGQAANPQP